MTDEKKPLADLKKEMLMMEASFLLEIANLEEKIAGYRRFVAAHKLLDAQKHVDPSPPPG